MTERYVQAGLFLKLMCFFPEPRETRKPKKSAIEKLGKIQLISFIVKLFGQIRKLFSAV